MSPLRDASDRALSRSVVRTANTAATTRRSPAKHRVTRRKQIRGAQVVGLTAALAAAASASTVGVSNGATTQTSSIQPESITAARIDRRELASRDASRFALADSTARKLQAAAEVQAKARAAKQAANRSATERRAAALLAAKKAAIAAEAKKKAQAAADAAKAEKAEQVERARAAAEADKAPKASLPTTGYRITATFNQGGSRWARNHTGLDFAAPQGTPVLSVLPGEVISAEYAGAYGRQIKVRHEDGTVTSYAHMSAFVASVGDNVSAGEQIGSVGSTGNSTGPHVHFEVLLGGETQVNPKPWLQDHGVNP
ncbi:M23 family metallopeptidase [Kribbella deserti]|uniref:M23 family metallopeptidase n=1 Tax=Kribbella deserti TaxID=1926257 RepID=A0ABV6QYJ8_9ACTN